MALKPGGMRGSLRSVSTGVVGIPDSAIHQWKFDEGSGTSVADSIGGADGTVNGATWVSGTYRGGSALSGDGADDNVPTTTLGNFGSNMDGDFAVAVTVENSGGGRFGTSNEQDNTLLSLGIGVRNPGSIRMVLRNDSVSEGSSIDVETDGGHVNDGAKHRVVWNKTATSASGIEFWVDGAEITARNTEDDALESAPFTNFEFPFMWFASNNRGTPANHFTGILDEPIIFDDSLSVSQIQNDYDGQPWS